MNKEEARDKFGQWTEGSDGEQQWEIDHNKVRGMFLKYSRDVEHLEGSSEWPDADEWVQNFWGWLKREMGPAYKGILQCPYPSPSGRFDRMGQSEAVRVANNYYESHDEFRENLDSVWEQVDKELTIPDAEGGYENGLGEMETDEVIQTFFNIYEGHNNQLVGYRQSPNVRAYKYHIKQWVFETETIMTHEPTPKADALVEAWVDWMATQVLSMEQPIAKRDAENSTTGTPIPDIEDITEWCRELWGDSPDFRNTVSEKWNKDIHKDGDGTPNADEMVSLRKGIDLSQRDKSGQRGLTDY